MRTATEKYHAVLEGKLQEAEFVRQMRQAYPQFITQWNGYKDSVSILKQKSLIFEKKEAKVKDIDVIADQFPLNTIERGIDMELEAKGIDSTGNVSKEDYMKARVKVIANLQKDANHYINLVAGESAKVDKHDKMVEPKKGNEVDVHNGLKKADLKESYNKETLLKRLGNADDATIQTGNGREYIIYNPNSNNDDNAAMWHDDSVFALDQDGGEHEIHYKDIGLVMVDETTNESNQEESIANYIIKYYSNPKTGKSLIDDEIIGDFFKTHPESRDQEPQDALDNFQEFLSVNYEMPGDYMQEEEKPRDGVVSAAAKLGMKPSHIKKEAEDLRLEPEDTDNPDETLMDIGRGYLKGFNKPHSLTNGDLETLGKKVVDSLYKGDIGAAKAKFVAEAMSDDEMKKIAKYGKDTDMSAIDNLYKLGQKFTTDFDYEGMLKAGTKVRLNTPVDQLQQLFDSFEDVNYHREGEFLSYAIDAIREKDKTAALNYIRDFKKACKKTLESFNEGVSKVRKQLEGVEEGINERVGSLQEFISLIQDRAAENDTTEAEEAEEVMYALGEHYNLGVDILHGPKESIREGRRRKTQGGKVVTENDYETGGYVESMGPLFDRGVNMLIKAWEEWKMGPMTEPGMIEFAKKDVLSYLETQFMVEHLEEGKDLDEEYEPGSIAPADLYYSDKHGRLVAMDDVDDKYHDSLELVYHKGDEIEGPMDENKGKDRDGDGDVDKDDYMAGKDAAIKKAMGKEKIVKENIKSIILKVLEEGVINEAATNALAEFSETYGGYEGMKQAIISLQDVVTDIESYYDKTRTKIQKVYDTLGDIRNEEGLKVGGFLAPAIEQAFNKDLRPAVKGGFTKGLSQPKVRVISQADIDAHNSGERPLGEEEKQNVFSPNTINGAL